MSIIKDIILIISAIISTIFIIKGFHKWKKESLLKRKSEFAAKLLSSIYKLRNEMERIRSRYDLSSPPENIKESDRLKEKFSQRYEHYILYQNEFLELLATAEAYYGRELHDTCIKFNGLMNEHNRNLQTFLQQVDHKPKYGTPEHKEYKNLYEIIYLTDSSNEYTKEINNFIQQNFSFLIDEINYK